MKANQKDGLEHVLGAETTGNTAPMIDLLLEMGRERAGILLVMKEALLRGDDDEALERARELTGLPTKRVTQKTPVGAPGREG
jgi:hypothetical protein